MSNLIEQAIDKPPKSCKQALGIENDDVVNCPSLHAAVEGRRATRCQF